MSKSDGNKRFRLNFIRSIDIKNVLIRCERRIGCSMLLVRKIARITGVTVNIVAKV
ncbi:hypothetical protein [Wukongibacter sp. M2B1]|uniref:hypothetical protein n=1 Tax=Wukongibacter sp. M2B1 TaxID=3088895 RepID=UPI003D7A7951